MFGFDDMLALGAVSLGTSLIGGLAQGAINRHNAMADFEDNARLRWQMWNANNEYNRPVNVMARYREAGLNPNLIYGQMPQASQPVSATKETKPFNLDFNWLLKNQLENSELNNNLIRAEIANKLQQHEINDASVANTRAQTALLNQRLSMDKRASDDAHAESVVRRVLNQVTLDDNVGNQSFWDKVGSFLGFSGERGSGAPVRAGATYVGSLAKMALGSYLNMKSPARLLRGFTRFK